MLLKRADPPYRISSPQAPRLRQIASASQAGRAFWVTCFPKPDSEPVPIFDSRPDSEPVPIFDCLSPCPFSGTRDSVLVPMLPPCACPHACPCLVPPDLTVSVVGLDVTVTVYHPMPEKSTRSCLHLEFDSFSMMGGDRLLLVYRLIWISRKRRIATG